MHREFINKVIEIGKRGTCNAHDLIYFIPDFPFFNYSEIIFLRNDAEIKKLTSEMQIYYLKGLHLVEMAYSEETGSEYGFGSPSQTYELLKILDLDNRIKTYNWIAFNRGNFFIAPNISYEQNERNKQEKLKRQEQMHNEAIVKRNRRREIRIEEHTKRHVENSALRNVELERLRGFSRLQQLKSIIASEHPLDYYPEEFSKVTEDLVLELNSIERDFLNIKLEKIKEKSWWQKIKLEMQNWEA